MSLPRAELEVSFSARALDVVQQRPWQIVLAFLLLLGLGAWIYVGVRSALVSITVTNLHTLLDSEIGALDLWVREKSLNAERWAQNDRVLVAARGLLAAGGARTPGVCAEPARTELLASVDALLGTEAAPGINLVDRDGRVVASRFDEYCGKTLGAAWRRTLHTVFNGATAFASPVTEDERVTGVTAGSLQRPLVWFVAPVRSSGGEVIGALNIGKYADERFADVFLAARLGETGEAYAFDDRGRMLTKSRYRAELLDAGRLPNRQSEILNLVLYDPLAEDTERVFTRLVREAIARRTGEDQSLRGEVREPYSNYLGDSVVGAWRWLPAFDMGVAVEVRESEAFAPLQRLERAFLAMLLAAATAVLFLLAAVVRIVRLRHERDEAKRIGNYELLELVGRGGMASVYRARHRLLKRPTAVKIIELAMASDEMLARFDREVRLASQLMHPNTVEVFDYGRTPEGFPFCAMEFIDGLTLQQIVESEGPMPAARVAHVMRGIAGSLSEAHELGLVHRDIKPANVMLCRRGGEFDIVKVLDFGLIKDTRAEPTRDLTRALKVLGTPAYMAPERIEHAASADPRSDLYALGAVAFFMLAGRPPFTADNDLGLAYQVVHTEAPEVTAFTAAPVPLELSRLTAACLAKDPAQRPASAVALIETLDRFLLETTWTPAAARACWDNLDAAPGASTPRLAA